MRPDRKAIPTLYRGVQYRSRLEAKWAAFFDLLGWKYQYEPFDLEGWIPDFILFGESDTLVEVKPFPPRAFPANIKLELLRHSEEQEILLVGCSLAESCSGGVRFGEHTQSQPDESIFWDDAVIMKTPNGFDWCSENQSYMGRITGWYDGWIPPDDEEIIDFWNKSGNLVQWRGVRSEVKS